MKAVVRSCHESPHSRCAAGLFLVRTTSSRTAQLLCHDWHAIIIHIAGLAVFSRKLDNDPWNAEKKLHCRGQLCANLVCGTMKYFSPEQHWQRDLLSSTFQALRSVYDTARAERTTADAHYSLPVQEQQVVALLRVMRGGAGGGARADLPVVPDAGKIKTTASTDSGIVARNTYEPNHNEKSFSELLSSGARFKRHHGHQVNLELLSSKLRQTPSRVVVDHESWPQYVLTGAFYIEPVDGEPSQKDVSTALNKKLSTIRSFAVTLPKDDLNGSNMDYVRRHPDRFNRFGG